MERVDVRLGDFLPVLVFGVGAPDILSSTSVKLRTKVTSSPLLRRNADEDIKDERGARMPDMAES